MLDDELFPKRSTTPAVTTTQVPPQNYAENVGTLNFSLTKSLPPFKAKKQKQARFSNISITVHLDQVTLIFINR